MGNVVEENNDLLIKNCKKFNKQIGGKAYHIVKNDCSYDRENVSKCVTIFLCSYCYNVFNQCLLNG